MQRNLSAGDIARLYHRLKRFEEIVRHAASGMAVAEELKDHDLVALLERSGRQALATLETEACASDEAIEYWGVVVQELHELLDERPVPAPFVFTLGGSCVVNECGCRAFAGIVSSEAPAPPLHEGCSCVFRVA